MKMAEPSALCAASAQVVGCGSKLSYEYGAEERTVCASIGSHIDLVSRTVWRTLFLLSSSIRHCLAIVFAPQTLAVWLSTASLSSRASLPNIESP